MITNRIVVILIFILTFTMVIHAFSFPAYAQRFSITLPADGLPFPYTDPATGIQTITFSFYSPYRGLTFSTDTFDDVEIKIISFPPPSTIYGSEEPYESLCEKTVDRVIINTIEYTKINAKCFTGLEEKNSEKYIPNIQNNNMMVEYVATNQFSFENRYQEFINSLNTLVCNYDCNSIFE